MKPVNKFFYFYLLILLLPLHQRCQALTAVLPPTARIVPAETVFLLDIDNYSLLQTQLEKTGLYKFYKEPAMAAFIEAAKAKWKEKIHELDENDIFRTIIDTDLLPTGRASFAIVYGDSNEPQMLVITQWGENVGRIREAINKLVQKNIEKGGHQKKGEDYRTVRIETLADEASSQLHYCFIDDCFIAATDSDTLKFVIAHIKGASSPALGADTDYTAAMAATGPYQDIGLYINIKQIIKKIAASDTTGGTKTKLANFGIDNISCAGCSIGLARRPGSSYCGKILLKVSGAKKGICKILDLEPAAVKPYSFIPESAYSLLFVNINIKKAYDELYNILYLINPAWAAQMRTPLVPPSPDGSDPGLELKSGIIDHLGSQVIIVHNINKPFSRNAPPTESLIALSLTNRGALEKSISALHSRAVAASGATDTKREILGHTIYILDMPILPMLGGAAPMQGPGPRIPADKPIPQMPRLAVTVTNTHMIFGTEQTLERAIRNINSPGAASAASAKWFTAAKSAIDQPAVGFANLQNDFASAELIWWMMKENKGSAEAEIPVGTGPGLLLSQAGSDVFNFSLLPEYSAVSKYFGCSVFYGSSRPDGFFFQFGDINTALPQTGKK